VPSNLAIESLSDTKNTAGRRGKFTGLENIRAATFFFCNV
jgi:hypothetical protein